MSPLYTLSRGSKYEGGSVLGVFGSRKEAEDAAQLYDDRYPGRRTAPRILEWENEPTWDYAGAWWRDHLPGPRARWLCWPNGKDEHDYFEIEEWA